MTTTTKQARVRKTGRYGWGGDLSRVCKCGHTLGEHSETGSTCHHDDGGQCDCEGFKPAK